MSIRSKSVLCLRLFRAASSVLSLSDAYTQQLILPTSLNDEVGRFRVWAGNLGATQQGHSSLDYRLRESPLLQENVSKLLDELQSNLTEAVAVISGDRQPYESQAIEDLSDQDDDSSYSDGDYDQPRSELRQRFGEVVDIINNLYMLSIRIRSPVLRSRAIKAASYTEVKDGVDLFSQYAVFDHMHVANLLRELRKTSDSATQTDDYLEPRLWKAITKRRRIFRYWRRHRDKLSGPSDVEDDYHILAPMRNVAVKEPPAGEVRDTPTEIQTSVGITPSVAQPKTLLSVETEATAYYRSLDDLVDAQSVTSVATTARDLSGQEIDLPPAPRDAFQNDRDFECPYCYVICPARYSADRVWRTHLLQDLQPYICTYADCDIPDQLFRSRREWLEHEGAQHRQLWRCPSHPEAVYKSRQGLETHLREQHTYDVAKEQISSIVDAAETSAIDSRPSCPVCFVDAAVIGDLQNHIANHMERFAAFALPRDVDLGEDRSNSSMNGSHIRSGSSGVSKLHEVGSYGSPPTENPPELLKQARAAEEIIAGLQDFILNLPDKAEQLWPYHNEIININIGLCRLHERMLSTGSDLRYVVDEDLAQLLVSIEATFDALNNTFALAKYTEHQTGKPLYREVWENLEDQLVNEEGGTFKSRLVLYTRLLSRLLDALDGEPMNQPVMNHLRSELQTLVQKQKEAKERAHEATRAQSG